MMTAVDTHLASKGAPVIFGEWGVPDNENENDYINKNADMQAFVRYFVEQAKTRGFGTFYWMGLSDGSHRSVPEFNQPDLVEAMVKGYYGEDGYTDILSPLIPPLGSAASPSEESSTLTHYYDLQGCQSQRPMRGLNIVRMRDGSIRKLIRK